MKKTKEIIVNGEVYAKYMVDGSRLYLHKVKDIINLSVEESEEYLALLISTIENIVITDLYFLNVDTADKKYTCTVCGDEVDDLRGGACFNCINAQCIIKDGKLYLETESEESLNRKPMDKLKLLRENGWRKL